MTLKEPKTLSMAEDKYLEAHNLTDVPSAVSSTYTVGKMMELPHRVIEAAAAVALGTACSSAQDKITKTR